jgi:CRP/FNR family transcriptional regulator
MAISIPKNIIPHLNDELRNELQSKGHLKQFETGEVILKENSNIKSIPIILSGSLKVSREDQTGKELLLYYVKPGESCVMSFFGGLHHDTSKVKAIAEEPTEILFISVEDSNEWLKKFPGWIDFIFLLYHKRFEELLEVVNEIAFQKIDERILLLLQKKTKLSGQKDIITTHQQIADELGTSREVVSRLLKQMEGEGKIALSRNKITLN